LAIYNITEGLNNITDVETFPEILANLNSISGNLIAGMLHLTLFIILFMTLKQSNDPITAASVSSFVGFALSVMMYIFGATTLTFSIMLGLFAAITGVMSYIRNN